MLLSSPAKASQRKDATEFVPSSKERAKENQIVMPCNRRNALEIIAGEHAYEREMERMIASMYGKA